MKYLHTADLHLGYRQYGIAAREGDFVHAARQIAEIAVAEHVNCVLVSGDVFDSPRPPAYAVQAFRGIVERLAAANIPVVTIDGNHDLASGRWSTLCGARPAYCDGVPPPRTDAALVDFENHAIPRTDDLRASCRGIVGIDYCPRQSLFERLEEAARAVEGGRIPAARVVMLHMEIAEMAAYSTAVSIDELEPYMERIGARYVALGHIHNRVVRRMDCGRVYCYPGSTEVNDTTEVGVKTVELVEIGDDGRVETETRALDTRRFLSFDVSDAQALERLMPTVEDPANHDAFWLVKTNLSAPGDLATRVHDLMAGRLYKMLPYGSAQIERMTDRTSVTAGLKEAVAAFFDADSDEAHLVVAMIENPNDAKAIASRYLESKTQEKNADEEEK